MGRVDRRQILHLHPVARAAWFGLLATALNLFPLAQLDGGHVAYAVFGRNARWITLGTAAASVGLTLVSMSWVAGAAALIFILCFTPEPVEPIERVVPALPPVSGRR